MTIDLTRRGFLAGLGIAAGGLMLGSFGGRVLAADAPAPTGMQPNAFLHLATDGTVTIWCARSEMGQGVRSSLHLVIADELGADLGRVKLVQAIGDKQYGDQNTDGSSSVRLHLDFLRQMGAVARELLVTVAAARWKVKPAECTTANHRVLHRKSRRSLPFGDLVAAAAKLPVPDADKVTLRPFTELTHVGQDKVMPLHDGVAIVTGGAQFGADIVLPDMLTAVIARPPVLGGKVASVNSDAAKKIPGVRHIIGMPVLKGAPKFQPLGGVAVVADNTWAALRGRRALQIEWDHGEHASYDSAAYKQGLLTAVRKPGKSMRKVGDVPAALKAAARTVEAEYYVPHLAHVPMEPPAAVARFADGKCEVWASTQNPQAARTEVAAALGLDEAAVTVHVTLIGGGFGRKSKPDFVVEAALLAKQVGRPVRVQWTREDDIRHDYLHAVSAQRLVAGLDGDDKVTAWLHRIAFPPIPSIFDVSNKEPSANELGQGVLDRPLAVPNVAVEIGEARAHVRIGWLRSVCNIFHGFAVSSFMDELAHARKRDPRDNLLELLGPPRLMTAAEAGVDSIPNYKAPLDKHPIDVGRYRAVIERVCKNAGWDDRGKSGRALGLAAHYSFLTWVGVVAALVQDGDQVRVDEVWVVCDAGTVINRERVRSQMEGAVIFGMSIAMHGEITAKRGVVEQSNYRDFKVVRLPEAPRAIHVDIVTSTMAPGGVGEPGVPPVAPAIANAYFALTGKRVRQLPLRW